MMWARCQGRQALCSILVIRLLASHPLHHPPSLLFVVITRDRWLARTHLFILVVAQYGGRPHPCDFVYMERLIVHLIRRYQGSVLKMQCWIQEWRSMGAWGQGGVEG